MITNDTTLPARDGPLYKWATVLMVLALIALAFSLFALGMGLFGSDAPLVLNKGMEVWKTSLHDLKTFDYSVIYTLLALPEIAWVYCVLQMTKLAVYYRKGWVFEHQNVICFVNIGKGLIIMGITSAIIYPAIAFFLYFREVSPWLADIPWLASFDPDLIVSGTFFFVLGKIMARGVELATLDRLTV